MVLPSDPETIIRSRSLPEEKILLEVRDNGMGMSEEVRKKLFTIFFSTKGSRGTGLGLLLSHKIVQEHGGEIRVQSSPQQGASFQVILPKRLHRSETGPHPRRPKRMGRDSRELACNKRCMEQHGI